MVVLFAIPAIASAASEQPLPSQIPLPPLAQKAGRQSDVAGTALTRIEPSTTLPASTDLKISHLSIALEKASHELRYWPPAICCCVQTGSDACPG